MLPKTIDALCNSIQRFGVTQNENVFDFELNDIMSKMNITEENDHWEDLQKNYSKLKYLSELINFYNLPSSFRKNLSVFMESIDTKTQYYLSEINWSNSDPDIKDDALRIKEFLEMSLNQNDSYEKLETVIKAYQILVPMIESFVGENCKELLDQEFLSRFEPPAKRQKH